VPRNLGFHMNSVPPTDEELLDAARHADDGARAVQEAYLALPGQFLECRAPSGSPVFLGLWLGFGQ
jgi:hypothetical protein